MHVWLVLILLLKHHLQQNESSGKSERGSVEVGLEGRRIDVTNVCSCIQEPMHENCISL